MKTTELQVDVDRMQCGECTLDELREFARHPAGLIRVNAIDAIAKYHASDEATNVLIDAAISDQNNIKLMGTETVAFVAIGKLLASPNARRRSSGIQVFSSMSDDIRNSLIEYLNSEKIPIP